MSEPTQMQKSHLGQVVGTGLVALDRIHIGTCDPVFEELGGSCGNVLISLAMLGRSVAPLLRLGSDEIGVRLEQELRSAGADTRLVSHRRSVRSPVIVEHLDPISTKHSFSFTCPTSSEKFGTYQSITSYELEPAKSAISSCAIFYADRLSETICVAMETAAAGGAIVHFEPSSISDQALFTRALSAAHIFKFSADRLIPEIANQLRDDAFSIVTNGSDGLELRHGGLVYKSPATDAPIVKDTCGSGDMVTLGLIDTLLQAGFSDSSRLRIEIVLDGIRAGQRLAAENCAYIGARGLFRERGASYARALLAQVKVRQHAF